MQDQIGVEPFGRWLVGQTAPGDWMGAFATAEKMVPALPEDADPEAVRRHMEKAGAEADMFEQLDDAERNWLCL